MWVKQLDQAGDGTIISGLHIIILNSIFIELWLSMVLIIFNLK